MHKSYDFLVIGAGVFGAWIAHHLQQRGAVTGLLDAYGPANSRASSGGETRIIRMGYGPDRLYTDWSAQSLPQWRKLAERVHRPLFQSTGVLWLSDDKDPYTRNTYATLQHAGIECQRLSAAEIGYRYPEFVFPEVAYALLEPSSGVLMARQAVQALVQENIAHGMDYTQAAAVAPIIKTGKLDYLQTTAGESFSAATFIFACGPWLPKLFPEILSPLIRSTRQEVFFLGPPAGNTNFQSPAMPALLHRTHPDCPYALPNIESRGFKFAFDNHGPDFDPDQDSRILEPASIKKLRNYLRQHIPALQDAPIVESRVCQYENSASGDFLIDHHPEYKNVWLVGAGSGHGFKHGPALGQYISDLIYGDISAEPRFSLSSKRTLSNRAIF